MNSRHTRTAPSKLSKKQKQKQTVLGQTCYRTAALNRKSGLVRHTEKPGSRGAYPYAVRIYFLFFFFFVFNLPQLCLCTGHFFFWHSGPQ